MQYWRMPHRSSYRRQVGLGYATFSASPLPLPGGALLNDTTGLFTFEPGVNEIGAHTITFTVDDGRFVTRRTVTFTVPPARSGRADHV